MTLAVALISWVLLVSLLEIEKPCIVADIYKKEIFMKINIKKYRHLDFCLVMYKQ